MQQLWCLLFSEQPSHCPTDLVLLLFILMSVSPIMSNLSLYVYVPVISFVCAFVPNTDGLFICPCLGLFMFATWCEISLVLGSVVQFIH